MTPSDTTRRDFLRTAGWSAAGIAGGLALPLLPSQASASTLSALTPDQALARLKAGNADMLAGRRGAPQESAARRIEIAKKQSPFAVLVGCSDSRVPPELLFGSSLGELFIVRNAGNTVDTVAIGSVEYGILVLGAPLIVVLGHERCGAVDAALSVVEKNTMYPGSIGQMIEPIIPAALRAKALRPALAGDDLLDAAVRENVRRTVMRLRTSEPSLIEPLKKGLIRIVGARYDLDNGKVDFFME